MTASTRKRVPPGAKTPAGTAAAEPPPAAPSGRARLWDNVKSFAGAILIFLVIRTFLIEAYQIPSPSMVPTLLVGDWLFVNKLIYGPHVPFTNFNLPGYGNPTRGDVVVFVSPPQDPAIRISPDAITPVLVKRTVAVGGDTLYMRDGVLYVNGASQPDPRAADAPTSASADIPQPLFNWQHRIEAPLTRFGPPPPDPTLHNWGPLIVPANHLFMLGDNRDDSVDSRYYGPVPRENVRGRPIFVYYSYNKDDSDRVLPFLTDIRWRRIGHLIK
jgi:signal peptidase I